MGGTTHRRNSARPLCDHKVRACHRPNGRTRACPVNQPQPARWIAASFGLALALAAAVLTLAGTDANSTRLALRLTARWSFLLFWTAYTAGAIATLFGPAWTTLARRGPEFGLAFAAAHLVHIGLVLWLYALLSRPPLSGPPLVFFTVALAWTYLLAALSFGALSETPGPSLWCLLRLLGLNTILLAFAYDFVPAAIHAITHQQLWHDAEYVPFAALSLAAPLLTLAAAARRHRRPRHLPA